MLPVVKELVENCGLVMEEIGMEQNSFISEIKHKLAFVPLDYEVEMDDEDENADLEQTSFVLPDGEHIITVPLQVRCQAGELLMRSAIIGKKEDSLIENVFDSFNRCDENLRQVTISLTQANFTVTLQ